MISFKKLFSFGNSIQQLNTVNASHELITSFKNEGVFYSTQPELIDWQNNWEWFGQDSASISLLNQLEELGYIQTVNNQFFLDWNSFYQLLASEPDSVDEMLALLKLPAITDFRPSLSSHGSLEDLNFRIVLSDWINQHGAKLTTPPDVLGATVKYQDKNNLLSEAVWRLIGEVRSFYTLADESRSPHSNRQSWALIRRYAVLAKVPMADFLQRTVVLSPDKLLLNLHKSTSLSTKTIQVEPDFEGAPLKWLETFDRYGAVPERYDIPDGLGITQIIITPEVRSVLQEIRRWPNRYVTGERAEAFIRNPYAALGDAAVTVIDEAQFEEAKQVAGIDFERFFVDVTADEKGKISSVALLIESITLENKKGSHYEFTNDKELEDFIKRFEQRIQGGFQCLVWQGYELEILGDAEFQLTNLKLILSEWQPKHQLSVTYADIYDLDRYSDRVESIGVEKKYVSPYIARKSEEEGWVPENIEFGISFVSNQIQEQVNVELNDASRQAIEESISQAERQGLDEIIIPGIDQPVAVADAKQILSTINDVELEVNNGEFIVKKPHLQSKSLVIKSNIDTVNYFENRQKFLALPINSQVLLPASLRESITLKQHQLQGVAWLQHLWNNAPEHCRGALLADDMGLGKTLQILAFIARCLEDDPQINPILIVAPVSLLENWQEEITKFFNVDSLPLLMLYGANLKEKKLERSEIDPQLVQEGLVKFLMPNWLGNAKLVLTTYETLRDLEFSLAAQHWSIMVCDEAQKIKNPNALVTRAAKKQNVRFKIACTGTPVENSLADLWCLFDFIQPGLLGALNKFGERYRRPIEAKNEEEKARVDELRSLIEPQTLRRTKAQVAKDLPKKIVVEECRNLSISSYQVDLYKQAVQAFKSKDESGAINNHLGLIQYLRQVCTSPYPINCKEKLHEPLVQRESKSPKLKWLLNALVDIRDKNEKVIVFVEFLDLQRQLQRYIAERYHILPDIINGSTSAAASAINSRQKRIKAFQEKPGFGVIILSPLAVGFGVNIQAANHVIHFTRTWNPAKEDQATDRAYRIGQVRDVYVYYPVITAGFLTFDMKLDKLLDWKRGLSGDMLNGCGDLSASNFDDLGAPEGGVLFDG